MGEAAWIGRVHEAHERAKNALLAERGPHGHWEGELSSSALSTATAILALQGAAPDAGADSIRRGLDWLVQHQHESGGWGDTILSKPNISTTLLCWAAFGAAGDQSHARTVLAAEAWICHLTGSLDPASLVRTLRERYGKDQTFSVPILMACALGGRLGPAPQCWKLVPQLPCELAALPRKWFAALSLPVVSYALPALIAIGQARHFHQPAWGPLGAARRFCKRGTLQLLGELQPSSGGYLEAVPLTSFVTMALGSMGEAYSLTAKSGVGFLQASVRADGSWPIDSNLATWVTTLSVRALEGRAMDGPSVREWILGQQGQAVHPYTLSAPGGFAWTDLPGGVPDADDTSGALAALHFLNDERDERSAAAAKKAVAWLMKLQNRDGGMPTFCRGWGTLPFDRSTPEITAHALASVQRWGWARQYAKQVRRALAYLEKCQHPDGWWEPLWFGNEHAANESNRCYGTAAVIRDLAPLEKEFPHVSALREKAARWLSCMQQADGSWGGGTALEGPGSVEETANALQALATFGRQYEESMRLGTEALLALTGDGAHFPAAPIGLYFARLWYYERLYPVVWTVAALRDVERVLGPPL